MPNHMNRDPNLTPKGAAASAVRRRPLAMTSVLAPVARDDCQSGDVNEAHTPLIPERGATPRKEVTPPPHTAAAPSPTSRLNQTGTATRTTIRWHQLQDESIETALRAPMPANYCMAACMEYPTPSAASGSAGRPVAA